MIGKILTLFYEAGTKALGFLTPDFFQIFYVGFVLFCLYSIIWLFSIKKRDAGLVNFLWGIGFAIQGLLYMYKALDYTLFSFFSDKFSWEKLTFTSLIVAHGVRLAAIFIAKDYEEGEDKRYHGLRERLGASFSILSYPLIFLPALCLNMIIGCVIYSFANANAKDISHLWYWMGISCMMFGGAFGALADIQKLYFRHNRRNEGKLMDVGLWGLCRHPNYFGEMLFWWGAYLCNFSVGVLWTIICPIVLNMMIFLFTGIPLVEAHMKEEFGERFTEYQNRVSMIIPFPRFAEAKGQMGGDKLGNQQQQNFSQQNFTSGEPMKTK